MRVLELLKLFICFLIFFNIFYSLISFVLFNILSSGFYTGTTDSQGVSSDEESQSGSDSLTKEDVQ